MDKNSFRVDEAMVQRIAHLAKISINTKEASELIGSMTSVLEMIHSIHSLQPNIEPDSVHHVVSIEDMPDDIASAADVTEHLAEHFPYFKDGYFIVPPFVSQD